MRAFRVGNGKGKVRWPAAVVAMDAETRRDEVARRSRRDEEGERRKDRTEWRTQSPNLVEIDKGSAREKG